MKTVSRQGQGLGGAPRRDLRCRAERRGDAPGRHRAARRRPRRDPEHQDPGRGQGRRREAVAPEGHRPGPPGLDPRAALAWWWRGPRPEAPQLQARRTPKKMVRLALIGALSDRASESKLLVVDDWGWDAPKTKDALAALASLGVHTDGQRDPRVLLVLDRSRRDRVEVLPQPRRPGADHPARGAQHLRRARERLARLHRGARSTRPSPGSADDDGRARRHRLPRPADDTGTDADDEEGGASERQTRATSSSGRSCRRSRTRATTRTSTRSRSRRTRTRSRSSTRSRRSSASRSPT